MTAITSLSAIELASSIAEGRLSPIEVVEAHIARIEAVNPALNAVVERLYESARHEALALTRQPAADPGPLYGVPISVKDCFDVAGARAACGLLSRAGHRPACDAPLVARLRAAGAIVVAKTNTPDNCFAQETDSLLFGRTNNPWDVLRSVGGSSGGEAALIAAGGSPLGLGSDIAGSIRLPAAFTGIVGLRPTSGALPEAGFWPPSAGRLADLNALGPFARRVEDVALAFAIMHGAPPRPLSPAALRGLPVACWCDDGLIPCSAAVRVGVEAAHGALAAAGMRPVRGAPQARRLAALGWLAYSGAPERAALAEGFGNGERWSPLLEAGRALGGAPRVQAGSLRSWLVVHYGSQLLALSGLSGAAWRARLRAQFVELVGAGGVAVCPVFPTTAPHHGWTAAATWAGVIGYQCWVNLAGLPALALPVGRSGSGMPVGVQIVGAPGAEHTVLAAGLAVQRALLPAWVGPAI